MFSAIRKRLSYANVAVTLALVFAMTGGAYAASKYVITSTKQIKPSVLAALKGAGGKGGAPGAAGAQGPQGPAGPAGPKGENGAAGPQGPKGENGTFGQAGAKGATGTAGVAGATGPTGQTGFTETLPPEKAETGAWSFSTSNGELIVTAFSFNIPLVKALGEPETHYVGPGETVTACPGTAKEPKAKPGNLCVYQAAVFGVQLEEHSERAIAKTINPGATLEEVQLGHANGTGTSGAGMTFVPTSEPTHVGYGTWAVTASAGS
jgi:hypothetical protein